MEQKKQQPEIVGQPSTMSPGDQAAPGTPGTGDNICPRCGGTGRLGGRAQCPTCNGSGTVVEVVGGGG